mgnify:CR=1 FL=1
MKNDIFTFEKDEKEKWSKKLNPKFFVEFYTTYGFPVEMAIEEIQKMWKEMSVGERLLRVAKCWKNFNKDNKYYIPENITEEEFYKKLNEK